MKVAPPSTPLPQSRIFRQILLGFGTVMAMLAAALVISAILFARLEGEMADLLGRQFRLAEDTSQLRRLLASLQSSKRGYILTGSREFRDQYESSLSEMIPLIARLRHETDNRLDEREHLLRFARVFNRYLQTSAADLALRERADRADDLETLLRNIQYSRGPRLSLECDRHLRALQDVTRRTVSAGRDDVLEAKQTFRMIGLSSLLLALFVTFAWGTAMARDLGRSLGALKLAFEARSVGALGATAPLVHRTDEIGDVARSFELMSSELASAEHELRETVEDQARLLIELRETNEALGRAMRVKSDFLATMSHELRTPLNAVIGLSGMLLDSPAEQLSPRARTALQSTRDAGTHLLTLLNDILDLAKLDAGRMAFHVVPVDPDPIARICVATVLPLVGERPINVEYVANPAPVQVMADPQRLRQVLLNLLSNAVKFTAAGDVELGVSRAEGRVVFAVRDTGIGISESDLRSLFEEFHQLSVGDNRTHSGSGLGLALARRMAHAMDGDISVTSTPSAGSTFTLSLPAAEGA